MRTHWRTKPIGTTRYSQARTLARRICRLPGQSRNEFKSNVLALRRHFEQFNVDVSEICQWLMPLRPEGKHSSPEASHFWEFFLEPAKFLQQGGRSDNDTREGDRVRRLVFDVVASFEQEKATGRFRLPEPLVEAVGIVSDLPLTSSAENLFTRLAGVERGQRQVLLKAAAEWIMARYWRGRENWERHHEEWQKEKGKWQNEHPELTNEIREEFNNIFRDLQVTRKKPRICFWERLKARKDDCQYAGERIKVGVSWQSHAALCVKYKKFRDRQGKNFKKYFVENAGYYLKIGRKYLLYDRRHSMQQFLKEHPQARWFPCAWKSYLHALNLEESGLVARGPVLPHCVTFASDRECVFNKHTEQCIQYRSILEKRADFQPFDALYREWRAEYLSGPSKPSFRYPSKRTLPMPKIFGTGYFRLDFVSSVLELRLEGMPEGHFMRFGFARWPRDYDTQPEDTNITSAHVNFIGTRARVGFRFEVEHKESRFGVSQDQIDDLRSRKYPRQAQDQEFLDEARQLLLEFFNGDAQREMKLLAVDLGQTGAAAAVFVGRRFEKSEPLKIIKIKDLSEAPPKNGKRKKARDEDPPKRKKHKGLDKRHVGDHLEIWRKGAQEIAASRKDSGIVSLGDYDLRSLSLHVRWMIRDWVRLNASQIIKTAERDKADLIVLESLRGFRAPGYDTLEDEKKRFLAFFAYGRIRRKVKEKAVERGMRVVTVPYLKSSQFCAECGKEQQDKSAWEKNKRKHKFICEHCEYKSDSDQNAARVLGRVFWGEIRLPTEA